MRREEIIKNLENELKDYQAKLVGWQNVKRLTKKDGSNFAIKGKNFDGAKFGQYSFVEDEMHPYLTITYKDNYTWRQDNLQMYIYLDELKKDDTRLNNKEQIYNAGSIIRSTYIYNIEECFQAIQKYIKFLEEKITDYENQIKNANKYIEKADNVIKQIKELINSKDLKCDFHNNSLGYAIQKYIKDSLIG